MKVINNSNKIITLINNKKINRYDFIILEDSNEQLLEQINNLLRLGLIRVEN